MSKKGQGYYVGTPNASPKAEVDPDGGLSEAEIESEGLPDPAHNAEAAIHGSFASDAREVVPVEAATKPADAVRHGAFAHHRGKAEASFSIAHNGMVIDVREHQAVDADDGLFDAMQAANAPVAWR